MHSVEETAHRGADLDSHLEGGGWKHATSPHFIGKLIVLSWYLSTVFGHHHVG
jgi:hypothetical protein